MTNIITFPHPISQKYRELAATPETTLKKLQTVQNLMLAGEQVPIPTDHVLHAGMYVRTITMPPGTVLMGALVKIPTVVTVVGSAKVYVGDGWTEVGGVTVLPARAGRKQIFVSLTHLVVSMAFPTQAKTIEEAEKAFTDEHQLLLSHTQDMNTVRITGE
jgi:hypothetical protein